MVLIFLEFERAGIIHGLDFVQSLVLEKVFYGNICQLTYQLY